MKNIRKIARILTLPIIGKERRKTARQKTEAFIHKFLRTEYYRCEQIYLKGYEENRKIGFDKYHLISLGYNCFARMTFNYWGLKPRKADGEKTMPFDISVHPLESVCQLLESHFAHYFDKIEFSDKGNCWINPEFKITFVHDHENDKELFLERYHSRIKALDEAIGDDIPCLFFAYNEGEIEAAKINQLYQILLKICSHKPFKLIYMVFNAPLPEGINQNIATYQADYPQGYVHMDKFTKYTFAGLGFEKAVVDFTREKLQQFLEETHK